MNMNHSFDTINKNATQFLKSFFHNGYHYGVEVLISKPVFLMRQTPLNKEVQEVTVQFSYYLAPNARPFSSSTLNGLTLALTQIYESGIGQPVNIQLELVRQYEPYMDASILAQYLAINASQMGFNQMMNRLLSFVPFVNSNHSFLPCQRPNSAEENICYITGIKVQLSGLLTSQRKRTRKTVQTVLAGTLNNPYTTKKTHLAVQTRYSNTAYAIKMLDYGRSTSKSRLGAFTVKV